MFTNISYKKNLVLEIFHLRRVELTLKKLIKNQNKTKLKENKIYVETLQSPFSVIALTLFLPVLAKIHKAELVGYRFAQIHWYSPLSQQVLHRFSIFAALGMRRFELIRCGRKPNSKHQDTFRLIESKRDLLEFEYLGVHIGDLIYDTYLNEANKPTINLNDDQLIRIFADACKAVEYWVEVAKRGDVSAVCVGHAVYKNGIPARVCIFYNIPVYQVTLQSIYSLRKNLPLAHFDFLEYPAVFDKLPEKQKKSALMEASNRFNQRLKKGVSPELNYLPVSAYKPLNGNETRVIKESDRFKVLIATHDFYDSPHCNGNTLFEDFYVWLLAVAELSKKSKFDWYIKNHPFLRGNGESIVNEILIEYPHIVLVPATTSHQQLIKEGISAVVTVYGTIASEYAAMGLKAVNACTTNPHCAYSFSFNPTTIDEFEDIVLSLDEIPINIQEEEVFEYFYMNYLHLGQSWAFNDDEFNSIVSDANNTKNLAIYSYYIRKHKEGQIAAISKNLEKCIEANNYRLDSIIVRK